MADASRLYHTRRRRSTIAMTFSLAATLFGLGWLVLILGVLLYEGFSALSLKVFTEMTPPPGSDGGLLNPIMGSLIMTSGLPYDSAAARGLCGAMTALLHGSANLTSAELARAVGPFDAFALNREPMLHVMQMHRDAVERIDDTCPDYLKEAARSLWDEVLDAGRA